MHPRGSQYGIFVIKDLKSSDNTLSFVLISNSLTLQPFPIEKTKNLVNSESNVGRGMVTAIQIHKVEKP